MKKIVIFLTAFALTLNTVSAKDYAKLQIKEMKHAQKYNTTQRYLPSAKSKIKDAPQISFANTVIKDPKIMKFGNYQNIDNKSYNEKMNADNLEYKKMHKLLCTKTVYNYNAQAKGEDYYKIYRIAEKIIRANKLDYINWRIAVKRESEEVNAYTTNTNYICITTALYDTFCDNEDALALVIGHEMGHALLGHQARRAQLLRKMQGFARVAHDGNLPATLTYVGMKRKFLIDAKNMEYAADIEGAKLAKHAGYDLKSAEEVMNYFNTLPRVADWKLEHPNPDKRIENLNENEKYFPDEWVNMGKYNIYNSDVLNVKLSSDRKSIVISAPANKLNPQQFYRPESMEELYARFGYMYYINGQFSKSLDYFGKLFEIDHSNAPAYLYASYAAEALYKNTGNSKYLKTAKDFAKCAQVVDPKNKYILEQIDAL